MAKAKASNLTGTKTSPLRNLSLTGQMGDPAGIKHPNSGLVRLIMDKFQLTEADLSAPLNLSLEQVEDSVPGRSLKDHLAFFQALCGDDNVRTDTYTRIARSYGKGMLDALRLRRKIVENLPDCSFLHAVAKKLRASYPTPMNTASP